MISIHTNTIALKTQRALTGNTQELTRSLERLSTGYRINRASDDAAGLQTSELLRSQVQGSKKALENVQAGINYLTTMDGVLSALGDIFQRGRELMVQGLNDTYGTEARRAIAQEYDQLGREFSRLMRSEYNGEPLFNLHVVGDTDFTRSFNFLPNPFFIQAGANGTADDLLDLNVFDSGNLGMQGIAAFNTYLGTANERQIFETSLSHTTNNVERIARTRSAVGAKLNRLETSAQNLSISLENQQAAEARIRNVDMASESSRLISHQILQQAAAGILAQANQTPTIALDLLR